VQWGKRAWTASGFSGSSDPPPRPVAFELHPGTPALAAYPRPASRRALDGCFSRPRSRGKGCAPASRRPRAHPCCSSPPMLPLSNRNTGVGVPRIPQYHAGYLRSGIYSSAARYRGGLTPCGPPWASRRSRATPRSRCPSQRHPATGVARPHTPVHGGPHPVARALRRRCLSCPDSRRIEFVNRAVGTASGVPPVSNQCPRSTGVLVGAALAARSAPLVPLHSTSTPSASRCRNADSNRLAVHASRPPYRYRCCKSAS
jgi:hypothetical protein